MKFIINYLNKYQKFLFRAFLGMVACFFAVSMAAPARSMSPISPISPLSSMNSRIDFGEMQLLANESSLINYQQEAKSVLMAEGTLVSQAMNLKSFAAVLSGNDVYPSRVSTPAIGTVGAALEGNRLVVRGSFRDLTSPLRDYTIDPPTPPNPNVTSAVHIHKGTVTENGPLQYALQVQLDPDGMGGTVKGDYTLTEEQLQALNSGRLYADLHTKGFRGGELRGVFKP